MRTGKIWHGLLGQQCCPNYVKSAVFAVLGNGTLKSWALRASTPDAPVRQDDMSEQNKSAGFSRIDASRKTDDAVAPFVGSTADPGTPDVQGLYDPALDRDACGVGFIADIKGRKSHQIVAGRSADPVQPRTSRRHRRRSAHGRRRRHSGADPAQVFRQGSDAARLHAAGARPIRRRPIVHAAGQKPGGRSSATSMPT